MRHQASMNYDFCFVADKVDVDDLSDDDIQRLLTYVDDMINDVKDGKKNPEPDVTG